MSAIVSPVALRRTADGCVVIFDGVTAVRIDPTALPTPETVAFARPKVMKTTTLGALRGWCDPDGDHFGTPGRICNVVVDPAQVWRAIGSVLGALPHADRVGLGRSVIKLTPVLVVMGAGWEAVIAGLRDSLDPKATAQHPAVDLGTMRAARTTVRL